MGWLVESRSFPGENSSRGRLPRLLSSMIGWLYGATHIIPFRIPIVPVDLVLMPDSFYDVRVTTISIHSTIPRRPFA